MYSLQAERSQVSVPVTFSFPFQSLSASASGSITLSPVTAASPSSGQQIAGVSIDGVSVPSVVRRGKLFLPVKVVEKKILRPLLMSYPSTSSSIKLPRLPSYYVTENEASNLTANVVSVEGAYVAGVDLVVAFDDFRAFYEEIKAICRASVTSAPTSCRGGWIQINNRCCLYMICVDSLVKIQLTV